MKIKNNLNDELPLIKMIEIPGMVIVVRAIFHENKKIKLKLNLYVYFSQKLVHVKKLWWKMYVFFK